MVEAARGPKGSQVAFPEIACCFTAAIALSVNVLDAVPSRCRLDLLEVECLPSPRPEEYQNTLLWTCILVFGSSYFFSLSFPSSRILHRTI